MKTKRGRPSLAADEKRQVFALRLTLDERAAIEHAAKAAGKRVTEWARCVLLESSRPLP